MSKIKFVPLYWLTVVCACAGNDNQPDTKKDTAVVINADTVADIRTTVQKNPVASCSQKVPDELNDWQFVVNVYETKRKFHYVVRMQYKELRVTDSINVPNIGIEPQVKIEKDSAPFSCTVGFIDKKGKFKPLSRASVQGERLRFKKVAAYAVGVYRTKAQ